MKSFKANGQTFYEGCVFKDNGDWFSRVIFVGKERIVCACSCETQEETEETEVVGSSYTKQELEDLNAKVVSYKICGPDKNGDIVRQFDEVERFGIIYKVLDFIDSFNGDGRNYFIIESRKGGGWSIEAKSTCTLVKTKQVKVRLTGGEIVSGEIVE